MSDQSTREYLQGYGSFAADFNRLFDQPVQVYEALQQAGLSYHHLKDAGLEMQDLGELARCRDAWKRSQSPESPWARAQGGDSKVSRETLRSDQAR